MGIGGGGGSVTFPPECMPPPYSACLETMPTPLVLAATRVLLSSPSSPSALFVSKHGGGSTGALVGRSCTTIVGSVTPLCVASAAVSTRPRSAAAFSAFSLALRATASSSIISCCQLTSSARCERTRGWTIKVGEHVKKCRGIFRPIFYSRICASYYLSGRTYVCIMLFIPFFCISDSSPSKSTVNQSSSHSSPPPPCDCNYEHLLTCRPSRHST